MGFKVGDKVRIKETSGVYSHTGTFANEGVLVEPIDDTYEYRINAKGFVFPVDGDEIELVEQEEGE